MTGALVVLQSPEALPALSSHAEAIRIMRQFFEAELRSAHTRRAYQNAATHFFRTVGQEQGGDRLETINPLHISSWLNRMAGEGLSLPTIKQRLAALRHLFQVLARERIIPVNPAAVVRGPAYSAKRGKTPVLAAEEARRLLDAIDTGTLMGLRDRALIGTMVYSFARIGAVLLMKREDVFTQQRRLWLRLHEKRGKRHDVPCHHTLETYLCEYIEAGGITAPNVPLFQTLARAAGRAGGNWNALSGKPMSQSIAWRMVRRRALAAGIGTAVCNHTFRATGITTYLKNGGTIERAAVMANHTSTRTTQLYDRRPDDITLDEVERIQI